MQLNDRIGKTNIAHNGMTMTIIAYKNANDIDVQFEDGTIIKHKTYQRFKSGGIANYTQRTQETNIAKNGMKMTLIKYRNSQDIDVQFEDGTIVKHKAYKNFKNAEIKNPKKHIHVGIITTTDYAYKYKGIANFICHCTICNKDYIMTIQEMKDHTCQKQNHTSEKCLLTKMA